jgi:hypothetical protein
MIYYSSYVTGLMPHDSPHYFYNVELENQLVATTSLVLQQIASPMTLRLIFVIKMLIPLVFLEC